MSSNPAGTKTPVGLSAARWYDDEDLKNEVAISRHTMTGMELDKGNREGATMEVEMKIRGLMMDPVTNMPIVILKDAGCETVLPIWVGVSRQMRSRWRSKKLPRPVP